MIYKYILIEIYVVLLFLCVLLVFIYLFIHSFFGYINEIFFFFFFFFYLGNFFKLMSSYTISGYYCFVG